MRKKQTFPLFGVGFAVVPRPLGKGKDRGKNTSDRIARTNCSKECRDWPAVIGQSQLEINLARCWHTFGGRRIESPPGGGTPPATHSCGRSRPRKSREARSTRAQAGIAQLYLQVRNQFQKAMSKWSNILHQKSVKKYVFDLKKTLKMKATSCQNQCRI